MNELAFHPGADPHRSCVALLQRFRRHTAEGTTLTNDEAKTMLDILQRCCIVARSSR